MGVTTERIITISHMIVLAILIMWESSYCTQSNFVLATDGNILRHVEIYNQKPEELAAAKNDLIASGKSVDVEQFYEVAEKHKLKSVDRTVLWQEITAKQHSYVSKDELCRIIQSKRQSIKSILCTYRIGNDMYKYVLKNNNAYFEWNNNLNGQSHGLRSVSSKDLRIVHFPTDQDNHKDIVNASISPLSEEYVSAGLCSDSPLSQSMLENTSAFGSKHWGMDLCNYIETFPLACIFEKTEELNGHHCIVLADLYTKIYLDIERDFALYALLDYQVTDENKENSDKTFTRSLDSSRILHNLKDYGNGIWLPEWVEKKTFNLDGSVNSESRITYEEIKLNIKLKDSFFEDVIPDGALVADSIRDMVYMWGNHSSIGSLIKETVKTKRQTIFRNLSVILGLCFIACWGIVEWRRRRLSKGDAE